MTEKEMLDLHRATTTLETKMEFVLDELRERSEGNAIIERKLVAMDKKLDKQSWILYALAAGVASQLPSLSYLTKLIGM